MITIKKPQVISSGKVSRLSAEILVDDVQSELWMEVDEKYHDMLCADCSDAFVAGLIFMAILNNHDITFEAPISQQLKEQLEYDYIDVLAQRQPRVAHSIRLIGPSTTRYQVKERSIASGCSCGVDCLYTLKRRVVESKCPRRYLVVSNMHGHVAHDNMENETWRWEYLRRIANSFSKDAGIPLIEVDTNYGRGEVPGIVFEGRTTFGNLFVALGLQNGLTDYYVASGGPVVDFGKYLKGGILGTDCSNFDLLTLSAFSTQSMKFIVNGLEDRTNKVRCLCDWPLALRHLDVCHVHKKGNYKNGTYDCPKCIYTIQEIMAVSPDALDKFKDVFDVEYIKAHKEVVLAELIRKRLIKAETALECWPFVHQMGFSKSDWIKAILIVVKKIIKKVGRRGCVNHEFNPYG